MRHRAGRAYAWRASSTPLPAARGEGDDGRAVERRGGGARPAGGRAPCAATAAGAPAARGVPLVLLIGGAPGTGKSTIATQVAHRLGITRIVSTDAVRQVMRAFISRGSCRTSTRRRSTPASPSPRRGRIRARDRRGLRAAGRDVRVGVRGIVDRAVAERFPLVLEGVHLVPGLVPATMTRALVSTRDRGRPTRRSTRALLRARAHRRRAARGALPARARRDPADPGPARRAAPGDGVPVVETPTSTRPCARSMVLERVAADATLPAVAEREKLCRCAAFASVTERAALAGGRLLASGDEAAREDAATAAMRAALDQLRSRGALVNRRRPDSPLAEDDRGRGRRARRARGRLRAGRVGGGARRQRRDLDPRRRRRPTRCARCRPST